MGTSSMALLTLCEDIRPYFANFIENHWESVVGNLLPFEDYVASLTFQWDFKSSATLPKKLIIKERKSAQQKMAYFKKVRSSHVVNSVQGKTVKPKYDYVKIEGEKTQDLPLDMVSKFYDQREPLRYAQARSWAEGVLFNQNDYLALVRNGTNIESAYDQTLTEKITDKNFLFLFKSIDFVYFDLLSPTEKRRALDYDILFAVWETLTTKYGYNIEQLHTIHVTPSSILDAPIVKSYVSWDGLRDQPPLTNQSKPFSYIQDLGEKGSVEHIIDTSKLPVDYSLKTPLSLEVKDVRILGDIHTRYIRGGYKSVEGEVNKLAAKIYGVENRPNLSQLTVARLLKLGTRSLMIRYNTLEEAENTEDAANDQSESTSLIKPNPGARSGVKGINFFKSYDIFYDEDGVLRYKINPNEEFFQVDSVDKLILFDEPKQSNLKDDFTRLVAMHLNGIRVPWMREPKNPPEPYIGLLLDFEEYGDFFPQNTPPAEKINRFAEALYNLVENKYLLESCIISGPQFEVVFKKLTPRETQYLEEFEESSRLD